MKKDQSLLTAYGEGPSVQQLLLEAQQARARQTLAQMSGQMTSLIQVLEMQCREAERREQWERRLLRRACPLAMVLGIALRVAKNHFFSDAQLLPSYLDVPFDALIILLGIGGLLGTMLGLLKKVVGD